MTIADLKNEIDNMLPCRWEDDYLRDIKKTFDKYIDLVASIDGVDAKLLDHVSLLCDILIEVLNMYFDGRKGEAFKQFSDIMNGTPEREGLFSNIGMKVINPESFYYRARNRKLGVEFTIKDMFHIPLNQRGIVSTQRYSSLGYPCLYLGNTVYSCWEELRRLPFDTLMFSAYKVKYAFKVFDMRVPDDSAYSPEFLGQTIKRIPLIIACSFIVKNSQDVFKPEYIISQMLLETIISNNRRITQRDKSEIDPNIIWGVIYTSTHVTKDFPYGKRFLENIVLPVVQTNRDSNYCNYLASLFEISRPSCYEYESLKENTTRLFWENLSQELTNEEKVLEQYNQSKMGYLEEKLKNGTFNILPHMVLGCPTNVIEIDHMGTPVSVSIRSSESWTIV